MHPGNQYMDPSHSCCRDHTPYPYYPPPRWEAGHPPMVMDTSCRPPSYGPWPYSGSTSHSCPPEFHSCCNHTYPPGYYSFRPPFSQELPPPYLYYHGPFPHHSNAYPSYFVPPSPYPVDQAPYGNVKFKSHCCGCPNHIYHGGEKSNLKIEEEMAEVKPQSDLKGANNSSIIHHPNYQYPVMWLPSGNMKDNGNGRNSELPPQLLSRWAPEVGERSGDIKRQEDGNQKAKQIQWPIIWMPAGHDEPNQETKRLIEMDKSPKICEDAPHSPKVKIIPLSCFENGNQDQGTASNDRSSDHSERLVPMSQPASTKHRGGTVVDGNVKTIPVVPEIPNNEKELVGQNYKTIPVVPDKGSHEKKIGGTCRTIPVVNEKESNKKSDNQEGKKAIDAESEGEKGKRKNVEFLKAKPSKLPPVCLRVDPLPRKRSPNGCSRSASLPNSKDVGKDKNGVEQTPIQNLNAKHSDSNKGINMAEVNEKSPGEIEKTMGMKNAVVEDASVKHTQDEHTLQDTSTNHTRVEQIPTSTVDQKVHPTVNIETQQNASVNLLQECDKTTTENEMKIQGEAPEVAKTREIYMSEPDAAVHIQSVYRGYQVRRWELLGKLRKIKKVHGQMQDVKKKLQDLEASSSQSAVKEQVALNETIMNLLFELDAIQGSHPSVREARKSVARELICLQEKLDYLCKQPFGECSHSNGGKASEEEICAGVCEEPRSWLNNSKELMNDEVLPSVSTEMRQDADSVKHKDLMEESTKEEEHDEGKAATPGECKETLSMDVMNDIVLLGLSTEQKHQMEESNTNSTEECPEEEKAAAKGVGSSEHYMEPLHDPALSEGSIMLKQCTSSIEHDHHTEHDRHTEVSNAGVSPAATAATSDSTTALATLSMQNGVDNDSSVESQVLGSAASVESLALKHDVAPPQNQHKELKDPFVCLDDSAVLLENEESHENDQVLADTAQGSTHQTDGTQEPSVGDDNNMKHATTANTENTVQSPLLEESLQSDSALRESEAIQQSEVFCGGCLPLVDHQTDHDLKNSAGGFAIGEEPLAVPLESKIEAMEDILNVAGARSNMVAEPTLPESGTNELPCEHDGAEVHENSGSIVSSDSQSDSQTECTSGDKTTEGVVASDVVERKEMLEEDPVCAAGANSAELEADSTKERGVQPAEGEEASVFVTRGSMKTGDNKELEEENQKLKEMLQKLLTSGNDQMSVITELSEKVKTLEKKLARKKRPKVRMHRPTRDATVKGH